MRQLYRSSTDKLLCGGLAKYLDVDPVIIRLLAIALFVINPGIVALLYIVACIIMPKEATTSGEEKLERKAEELIKGLRKGLTEGAKGLGVFIGVILVIIGAVMVLSNIWPTLVDILRYTWDVLVGFNKVIAGSLLLAIGLILIIITSRKEEEKSGYQQRSEEKVS
ncbi:MAG: hypothetical protein B6U85_03120 [Desulfurococcales archaeon ex4484_42]|nr:MAG: hypothetical protein B6U85_03120 [Desulfurococcales archaeon ex4484_42]